MSPLRDFYDEPGVPINSGADRARRQVAQLREVLDGSRRRRILDVGCGDGAATALIARRAPGHDVVGLDWSTRALGQAREHGFGLVNGSAEPPGLPFGDATFDVVVMSELIEHLVDTDAALDEARRVLRPGGTLLVSTPNLAAWHNRVLLVFGVQPVFSEVSLREVHGRPGSQVVGHLRLFTRRALVSLLRARGFRRITVAGACYHDVPRPLRPFDRAFRRWPSAASILLARAERGELPGLVVRS
ncbi:class I SAM-dependent methyltransferase [Amycolatopsis acidicola]|uniref:Class I SAM-dependent methyltransferase n=1 Tax=Amycolatopsis acidicola TaxID=2596893 RepID=A0A5N0UM07_9PSEU|nr:class I SAM-dependent methyltransferase [Amycolatopsis acidicola]KAA9149720.1 class I SAM-dependent methyltransferase [Amycolatopsis acidicola]